MRIASELPFTLGCPVHVDILAFPLAAVRASRPAPSWFRGDVLNSFPPHPSDSRLCTCAASSVTHRYYSASTPFISVVQRALACVGACQNRRIGKAKVRVSYQFATTAMKNGLLIWSAGERSDQSPMYGVPREERVSSIELCSPEYQAVCDP